MPNFSGREPESFDFEEIVYSKRDWVATVTINRPESYNAYTWRTLQEMTQAFRDASWDDQIAVVVLTGAGDKAFGTGGDVKEYASEYTQRPHDYWKWMGLFTDCIDILRNIGKPTIARLNGMVVGGGNEFNMACDLAIAADHVRIRQVGTEVGQRRRGWRDAMAAVDGWRPPSARDIVAVRMDRCPNRPRLGPGQPGCTLRRA